MTRGSKLVLNTAGHHDKRRSGAEVRGTEQTVETEGAVFLFSELACRHQVIRQPTGACEGLE